MDKLSSITASLNRPINDLRAIFAILSKVKPSVADDWLDSLLVVDGRVVGTQYALIDDEVSHRDFVTLYEALGYDFAHFDDWMDFSCDENRCVPHSGFTCDSGSCGGDVHRA